jgi:hypothetical protein
MKKTLIAVMVLIGAFIFSVSCSNRAQEEEEYKIKAEGIGEAIVSQAKGCVSQSKAYRTAWEYAKVTEMDFDAAVKEILSGDMEANKQMMLENKARIDKMLEGLEGPPEKYEEAHKKLKELYEVYIKLHKLALKPMKDIEKHEASVNGLVSQILKKKMDLDAVLEFSY